jgi:hypothetical protein
LAAFAEERLITIDVGKAAGTIRELNGMNGGPIVTRGAFDLSAQFKEIGVKHVRLHDVPWTFRDAVDIDCIFPNFDADVDDPANYNFAATDYYIKSIEALGAEMTFRLGYSAQWAFTPPVYNKPPKDFSKWVAICTHIVRHYNHGWANGFKDKIKYWEIWNEPDIPNFWTGSREEFYRLYEITAKAVKQIDPKALVGGPALAGHLDFLDGLLAHCSATQTPVDFVAWHLYAVQPHAVAVYATQIQEVMEKKGFAHALNVLDEWNYFPGDWDRHAKDAKYRQELFEKQVGGAPGAVFAASTLVYLQDSPVQICDFYQGTTMFWGGLFDEFGVPRKQYYAFKAFKVLLDTPERVEASGGDKNGFAMLAGKAKDGAEIGILISNFGMQEQPFRIELKGLSGGRDFKCEHYLVDAGHDFELVKSETLGIKEKTGENSLRGMAGANSVELIRLQATP